MSADLNKSVHTCTRTVLTCRPDVNGNRRYQKQCLDCGLPVGNFIAASVASKYTPLNSLPMFDTTLEERRQRAADEQREKKRADWWVWYNEYLKSEDWRTRTAAVHKRARGVCEGCGVNPSSQVHHLTYEHAGGEFLWELVAICSECHERVHPDDEGDEP